MIPGSLVSRIFNDMMPSRGKAIGGVDDEGMLTRFKKPELVLGQEGVDRRTAMMPEMERTAEEKKQAIAYQMFLKGETPDDQVARTGYYYGPDEILRKEISDDNAFLKVGLKDLKEGDERNLSELMEHPEFFAIYPELENANVKIYKSKDKENGYFDLKSGEIGINLNSDQIKKGKALETFTTLLHESQHAIQKLEKMDTGGEPLMFLPNYNKLEDAPKMLRDMAERMYLSLYGEAEARNVQFRYDKEKNIKNKVNFIKSFLKDPQSVAAQIDRYRLIRDKRRTPAINADQPTQFEDLTTDDFGIDPTLRGM